MSKFRPLPPRRPVEPKRDDKRCDKRKDRR